MSLVCQQEAEQNAQEEGEEDFDEFNPYLFIKQLPPYNEVISVVCFMFYFMPISDLCCVCVCAPYTTFQVRPSANMVPRLPARRNSRQNQPSCTLVLDLDETLVHCSVESGGPSDLVFPVDFNGVTYQVSVKKRPHMEKFLRMVSEKFEVVVFTASQQVYADTLLDILDPTRTLIKHRLFRDSCLLVEGNYLKDLNVLGRDMSQTVLVDNSPHAFGYQIDNGIPIESWYDDPNDTELLKLAQFLTRIENVDDVRPIVRNHFKTYDLIRNAR
jgi:Dullard-like phosphatase family protein